MKNKQASSLAFSVVIKRVDNQYVALCLDIDVSSVGSTLEEAEKNILDAIISYLEYAHDTNLETKRPVPLKALKEFLGPLPITTDKPAKSKKAQIEEISIPKSLIPSCA